MKTDYSFHAAQFFTAAIYEWQPVLEDDRFPQMTLFIKQANLYSLLQ
jgi:hypothetical protein